MPEIVVLGRRMSGPQCCSNPPTLNPSSGAGHVEKLGGLDSYVTASPDSNLAIVLISEIFGSSFYFPYFDDLVNFVILHAFLFDEF